MASKYLTKEKKADILTRCGSTVLNKVPVKPLLMSHLVATKAIGVMDSHDIQDLQKTSDRGNHLLNHLRECSLLEFISFCEVLCYKENRDDIVVDDFGLNMKSLKEQKKQLLREKEERDREVQHGKENVGPPQPKAQEQVTSRLESQPTQQISVAVNTGNKMDITDGGFSRCSISRGLQAPAIAANTQPSTSTFNRDLWKRLSVMHDALYARPPRVVIAVLDTGMYMEHPQLKNHIIGYKSVIPGEDEDVCQDRANHGTISGGVIVDFAGQIVDIINIKVNNETSSLDALHAGFKSIDDWEKHNPKFKVDTVVTSINASEIQPGIQDDFDMTLFNLARRTVIICSAANQGATYNDSVCYPASCPSVLAIGSVDQYGNRSGFSSQGHALAFMFQGEGFVSTSRPPQNEEEHNLIYLNGTKSTPNDWLTNSAVGTSFAAPQCAAVVANILSYTELTLGPEYRKKLTRTDQMRKLLISVCEQKHDNETGYGFPRLDKLNAAYIKDQVDKMYSS